MRLTKKPPIITARKPHIQRPATDSSDVSITDSESHAPTSEEESPSPPPVGTLQRGRRHITPPSQHPPISELFTPSPPRSSNKRMRSPPDRQPASSPAASPPPKPAKTAKKPLIQIPASDSSDASESDSDASPDASDSDAREEEPSLPPTRRVSGPQRRPQRVPQRGPQRSLQRTAGSATGKSYCHQCRRSTARPKMKCQGTTRRRAPCPLGYCDHCIEKRHVYCDPMLS